MKDIEKKYFDDQWWAKIMMLIKQKKYNNVFIELENYLIKYPNDICARITYIKILIRYGRLEEAEEIINNTIFDEKNFEEFIKIKIQLLCCQRKYEECYKIFTDNEFYLKKNLGNYYSILVFLKQQLLLPINNSQYLQSYTINQILSYSEDLALEHISKHVDDFDNKEGTNFNSDFPLREIYNKLREILPIKTFPEIHSGMILQVYIFKYNDSGRYYRRKMNYIKVICIQDTNKIITMFPYENKENSPVVDIELKEEKQEEIVNVKVKKISQIDKFNQRYKQNNNL